MAQIHLTKQMRESIIQRIMNDLPKEDYDSKARDLLVKSVQSELPKEIQAMLGTPLECHLGSTSFSVKGKHGNRIYACVPGATGKYRVPITAVEAITALLDKGYAQQCSRKAFQDVLVTLFSSFSTVEQLRDMFPQFDKYLPNAEQPTFPVAVVSDVISNLQQAGWPKGTKKP